MPNISHDTVRAKPIEEPGLDAIAVYDGLRQLGWYVECAAGFEAFAADGGRLGRFTKRKAVARAVSEADRLSKLRRAA